MLTLLTLLCLFVSSARARCPLCSRQSKRVHSRYVRVISDLPWQGIPVKLRLRVRRFFCDNPGCERKIFTERLPTVVAPHARRTLRLNNWLTRVAFALGGEPGARLLHGLRVLIIGDTVLKHIRSLVLESPQSPRVLSVDDFAFRKGRTYGMVLVDLERHRVVDILPDRGAEGFTTWLVKHPRVEVIARDRGGEYAEGGGTECHSSGGQVPSDTKHQRCRLEGIQATFQDDRASTGTGSITAAADPSDVGSGAVEGAHQGADARTVREHPRSGVRGDEQVCDRTGTGAAPAHGPEVLKAGGSAREAALHAQDQHARAVRGLHPGEVEGRVLQRYADMEGDRGDGLSRYL